jgi:methylenetetrahydrofolate reductase (NADPH)
MTEGSAMLVSSRAGSGRMRNGMVQRWRTRGPSGLGEAERAALRSLVTAARFELIPLASAPERARALPPGSAVTVTASPSHGIEATLELCERVVAMGHEATPHLSAHMIRDRAHLVDILARARAVGLRSAFVVGGDAKDTGAFHDGLALLRAIHEEGSPFDQIGVPAYPEGHPAIPDDTLMRALLDKQPLATFMSTQMCFNPTAAATWIVEVRRQGVRLPIHLGIPGVAELTKLMAIAARIGVADSARYLRKNRSVLGHLVRRGSFGPDGFLEALAPTLADPIADVRALHVFTFNQVEATAAWRARMLAELGAPSRG